MYSICNTSTAWKELLWTDIHPAEKIARFDFYDRASEAYADTMYGATKRFRNIILKQGTIFCNSILGVNSGYLLSIQSWKDEICFGNLMVAKCK